MTEIISEPGSKVQILRTPTELPGVCAICGSSRSDDRQYIDIGFFIEWHGQIYFCTFCMGQVARAIGYVKCKELDEYRDDAILYADRYERVLEKERICNEFIRRALSADFVESIAVGTVAASIMDDSELKELTGESSESNSGPTKFDQRTEQSDSVERSDDVSSITSSNDSFQL